MVEQATNFTEISVNTPPKAEDYLNIKPTTGLTDGEKSKNVNAKKTGFVAGIRNILRRITTK
jgi:hypothetical protein